MEAKLREEVREVGVHDGQDVGPECLEEVGASMRRKSW